MNGKEQGSVAMSVSCCRSLPNTTSVLWPLHRTTC